MTYQAIVIRTLEDFTKVPVEDLPQCLHAFGAWVLNAKAKRADLAQIQEAPPAKLEGFSWKRRSSAAVDAAPVTRNTPIEELNLRPTALYHLREMNVFCLEDCSEVFERELRMRPDVGKKTISQLREKLLEVGLDFKEDPDPQRALLNRSRTYRSQPLGMRKASIKESDHIQVLGLRDATFSRALRHGFTTVDDLLSFDLKTHRDAFGRQQYFEICAALKETGLTFKNPPTSRTLWRYNLVAVKDLPLPTDPLTPIQELQPWLGMTLHNFIEAGVSNLSELRDVVRRGDRSLSKTALKKAAPLLNQVALGATR